MKNPHNFTDEDVKRINYNLEKLGLVSFHKRIDSLIPFFCEFDSKQEKNDVKFKKSSLSTEEMLGYALAFYEDLDENMYHNIMNVLQPSESIIIMQSTKKNGGFNAVGLHNGERFINLCPQNNTRGLIVVAHELAHLLDQRGQKKRVPKNEHFEEIPTIFIEKIYNDYLLQNGLIDKKDHKANIIQGNLNFRGNLVAVCQERDILKDLAIPVKDAQQLNQYIESIRENDNFNPLVDRLCVWAEDFNKFESNNGDYCSRYLFGEIAAEALYQDYKKDRQDALGRLNSFFECSSEIDSIEECGKVLLGDEYEQKLMKIAKARKINHNDKVRL